MFSEAVTDTCHLAVINIVNTNAQENGYNMYATYNTYSVSTSPLLKGFW